MNESNKQADKNADTSGFTGRTRRRKTSAKVKFNDVAARVMITFGGIGTIVAVSMVCIFLVSVAIPLFMPAESAEPEKLNVTAPEPPVHFMVDEYRTIATSIYQDGRIVTHQLSDGSLVNEASAADASHGNVTAWAFPINVGPVAIGYEDGSVQLAELTIKTHFYNPEELEESLRDVLDSGKSMKHGAEVLLRTPEGQYRAQSVQLEVTDTIDPLADSPVRLIDIVKGATGPVFGALLEDGSMHVGTVRRKRNLMTGKTTTQFRGSTVPYERPASGDKPFELLLSGLGDTAFLFWRDGDMQRFDCRSYSDITLAESFDLLTESGEVISTIEFMNGRGTLMIGTSTGRLFAMFATKPAGAETVDGKVFVKAHDLPSGSSAITSMSPSTRSRMLAVGFEDGHSRLYHVSTAKLLIDLYSAETSGGVVATTIGPKDNAVVSLVDGGLLHWDVDPGHPAVTPQSIFMPLWYESYNEPTHVWQSSSGTDDFEPKYGLYPLIFGTIKATIYSMMFGLPIAILAAIYTSEFLHPRVKAWIKPVVEMMASLPSVVLGFLAAVIFAPYAEDIVPGILCCFLIIPLLFMGVAQLWQLLPHGVTVRVDNLSIAQDNKGKITPASIGRSIIFRLGGVRLINLAILFFVAIWLSLQLGPLVEKLLFEGNIRLWLDGQHGKGWPGWLLPMIPTCGILVMLFYARVVNPNLVAFGDKLGRFAFGLLDLAKWAIGVALTLVLAFVASYVLSEGIGWDPRGSFVGRYDQRNALIVGFVMGFAIIPIIYTIAEDALSAVPEHLRSASLGAGATPWQTATKVIMPTAMSGLFSATMIGLGRAVGETMIVLMAAGNTPVMSMNIFNGFRTLSANIAVELPEAPIGGTHYRMLFFAALTLFAMTFVVNTIAESVRQRFRKRAFAL